MQSKIIIPSPFFLVRKVEGLKGRSRLVFFPPHKSMLMQYLSKDVKKVLRPRSVLSYRLSDPQLWVIFREVVRLSCI